MILKRHEIEYIKSGCEIAHHFTSDVEAEREYLPPIIRYHSEGSSIRFYYDVSLTKDVEEKEWAVEEPDIVRKKRKVTKIIWLLSDETDH